MEASCALKIAVQSQRNGGTETKRIEKSDDEAGQLSARVTQIRRVPASAQVHCNLQRRTGAAQGCAHTYPLRNFVFSSRTHKT